MKLGRNDPCDCGSGRKYKNCCLPKDEEAQIAKLNRERFERESEALASEAANHDNKEQPQAESFDLAAAPKPKKATAKNRKAAAFNARWDEFEAQNYEGQIAVFLKTLEEKKLLDDEMAFEMLNVLYPKTVEHHQRDRYDMLVHKLREELPAVYSKSAAYYLDHLITNALVTGRLEAIPPLAQELAAKAGKDIDTFNNFVNMLAYHGQLSTLVEVMRAAWPAVKKSRDIVPWGIDEYAEQAADYVVFDYLKRHPFPPIPDPELIRQIEFYTEIKLERFTAYLAHLTGQANRHWTFDDFDLRTKGGKSKGDDAEQAPDSGRENLADLSFDFLGYLRRQENVPYTKGALARHHLSRYVLKRYNGELEQRQSMLEALMNSPQHNPKKRRHRTAWGTTDEEHRDYVAAILCPDRETLDHYLAGLLNFINPQHYDVAATFELVPAWLRFLESRQLIAAPQRLATLRELHGLAAQLQELWKRYPDDPALQSQMENWRQSAEAGNASMTVD